MAIIYNTQSFSPSQTKPTSFVPQQFLDKMPRGMMLPLTCINNVWQTLGGMQKVEQNMYVTLMTPVGRALMQPDFGSLLPYMLEEMLTATLKQQMTITVKNALRTWVPSINVISVTFDDSLEIQNVIIINIQYSLLSTGQIATLTLGYSTPDTTQYPPGLFVVQNQPVFSTRGPLQ